MFVVQLCRVGVDDRRWIDALRLKISNGDFHHCFFSFCVLLCYSEHLRSTFRAHSTFRKVLNSNANRQIPEGKTSNPTSFESATIYRAWLKANSGLFDDGIDPNPTPTARPSKNTRTLLCKEIPLHRSPGKLCTVTAIISRSNRCHLVRASFVKARSLVSSIGLSPIGVCNFDFVSWFRFKRVRTVEFNFKLNNVSWAVLTLCSSCFLSEITWNTWWDVIDGSNKSVR